MATIHTDASLRAYRATLSNGASEAGALGYYEVSGFWENTYQGLAHTLLLELSTIRVSLAEFFKTCTIKRRSVVRVFTDNKIAMSVVSATVSESPALMGELRRLHLFL